MGVGGRARYISGGKVKNKHKATTFAPFELKYRLNLRFLSLNWFMLCEVIRRYINTLLLLLLLLLFM